MSYPVSMALRLCGLLQSAERDKITEPRNRITNKQPHPRKRYKSLRKVLPIIAQSALSHFHLSFYPTPFYFLRPGASCKFHHLLYPDGHSQRWECNILTNSLVCFSLPFSLSITKQSTKLSQLHPQSLTKSIHHAFLRGIRPFPPFRLHLFCRSSPCPRPLL